MIRLLVPDTPSGIPAVTTVRSPSFTYSSESAPTIALSISSSVSLASWITIGYTPHTIDSCLATLSDIVAAIIFVFGLNLEITLDVLPLAVQEMIACALSSSAIFFVDFAIELVVVFADLILTS